MATYVRNPISGGPPSIMTRQFDEFLASTKIKTNSPNLIVGVDAAGFEYRLNGNGLAIFIFQENGQFFFTLSGTVNAIHVTGPGGSTIYETIEGLPNIPFNFPEDTSAAGVAAIVFGTNDDFVGLDTPDRFWGMGGDDTMDGKAGIDTAMYRGTTSQYTISKSANNLTISDGTGARDGTDTLVNVERLQFSDKILAFDDGAAQAYRIYQAAFARTPDVAGLSYWVKSIDNGLTMRDVAYGFVQSAEFAATYGVSPTNISLVEKLYLNILGRPAEKAGIDYWVGLLEQGISRLDVVASISESQENKVNLAPIIGQGVQLDPASFT